ncbi:Grx4 family monothiol glutaredoxin [Blochmannia endosymbiont of Colobopsis nipponica]|uniref:Grx4 family monothiol glutaredoxin n=1 Tax=Blochmannia endosymbiont of Colobopsis nipponica TaxID=2681987 RepID=UPI00177D1DC2|nr:Grx4 family monothiol glutaredoxin [Blochmannia endosymbiont of Colobopsis nipponica]QOI11080.1 Grx4 family monothiol glutaredoxin [Blochmannia endosymbiont of Colobopsis nipponica]
MSAIKKIQQQIQNNKILLYMKGTPSSPSCGFSSKAAQVLSICSKNVTYIDVLVDPNLRSELPKFSGWPTFPQLWIDGNLIGGCDLILEMYRKGKLQSLIEQTLIKYGLQK